MIGGGFISEGGYGCTFHPEITSTGKDGTDKFFLTKIQVNDDSAKNEIYIGKQIFKKIDKEDIDRHFAPVISTSDININQLDIVDKDKCTHIKKAQTNDFLLMRIKYVSGLSLDKHFIQQTNSASILRVYIYSFKHLLRSLKYLNECNIIHNDIKNSNIIYNINTNEPVLIDFGLSIPIDEVTNSNIRDFFYVYAPDYYYWSLEIHILNYSLHINENFNEEDLNNIVEAYISDFIILNAFTKDFKVKYMELCKNHAKKYLKFTQKELIKNILSQWETWDCYALCCEFIKLIYILTRYEDNKIIKNEFTAFVLKILLNSIHPDPERRPSIDNLIKQFNLFIMEQKQENLEEIIESINKNKKSIDTYLKKDSKKSTILEKRMSRKKGSRGK